MRRAWLWLHPADRGRAFASLESHDACVPDGPQEAAHSSSDQDLPPADVWFGKTQALFNRMAEFYCGAIQTHLGVLELSDQEALSALKLLTHRTPLNPEPVMPLAETIPVSVPAMFRRAAIHAALGAARSCHFDLDRWRHRIAQAEAKAAARGKPVAFRPRPPVPPRRWNVWPVFYRGQFKAFTGAAPAGSYTSV